MKHPLLFSLFILSLLISILYSGPAYSQSKKEIALSQLDSLKNGVLLVRLKTYSKKLSAIQKRLAISKEGSKSHKTYQKLNDQTMETRDRERLELYLAFKNNFDFCPVYFFYDTSTFKVLADLNANVFLDSSFNVVSSIHPEKEFFLIAEIATLESEFNNSSMPGLVIRNRKLDQLKSPFPGFIKREMMGTERTIAQLVQLLSKELE